MDQVMSFNMFVVKTIRIMRNLIFAGLDIELTDLYVASPTNREVFSPLPSRI